MIRKSHSISTPRHPGTTQRAERSFRPLGLLLFGTLLFGGCGIIPKDGPAGFDASQRANVTVEPSAAPVDFALVALSPLVLKAANHAVDASAPGFSSFVREGNSSQARIAIGDVISITIFESTTGGLFIPDEAGSRNGNYVTVPNVQVDSSGTIATPYAGSISVVGKTPQQVGKEIAGRLEKRAIEPQVVVTIADRRGNEVAVLGDVNLPQRFALDPGGLRALDAIARAGGPKSPAYETLVTIQRRGRTERAIMTTMVKEPRQNVQLRSGDTVYLSREPKVFMTLGATLPPGSVGGINNRRFPFDNDNETLSEAIAKSGGLDDSRADARAVFIYRFERKPVLEEMGVDTSRYAADLVPTIYSVDLSRSDGFFLSSSFYMKNHDIIFVSNSLTPDLNKLFGTVALLSGSFYNGAIGGAQLR